MNDCVSYSQEEWNVCQTCTPSTYNFRIETMCDSLPEIANCGTYVDNKKLKKNICKECEDGYYLDNSHEN